MKLLVIRHAIAEDRDDWAETGQDDAFRPLTEKGRRKMRAAAQGLKRVGPRIDLLAASPLLRAVQTAEIVAEAYGGMEPVTIAQLIPEREPVDLLRWLQMHTGRSTVAVVGHEPHLSNLICWLLTARSESWIQLKKGSACLLDLGDAPRAGGATLRWALAPSQLRRLGKK